MRRTIRFRFATVAWFGNEGCFPFLARDFSHLTNSRLICGNLFDRIDQDRSILEGRMDSGRNVLYEEIY